MLAKKQFNQPGIIFPVSASMLDRIDAYRKVLEAYSLQKYDVFKRFIDDEFEMPDRTLLFRFLEQNRGKLSKRAREKEFSLLSAQEVERIEQYFQVIWA